MKAADAFDEAIARAQLRRRVPRPEMLRSLREAAGVSQSDVARVLSVHRASVCRWESGDRFPGRFLAPYLALLDRLAHARSLDEGAPLEALEQRR